jgi:hypothetical protein
MSDGKWNFFLFLLLGVNSPEFFRQGAPFYVSLLNWQEIVDDSNHACFQNLDIDLGCTPFIVLLFCLKFMSESSNKNRSYVLGKTLVHEIENLYASAPISFIIPTSSYNIHI